MIRIYDDYYNLTIQIKENENEQVGFNDETKIWEKLNMKDNIIKIEQYIKSKGFIFSYEDLSNFYLKLKDKTICYFSRYKWNR